MNIYVLGDVSSFVAAFNSLVMILGVQSFVGGAALVGALVGLIAFLIFMMNKDAGSSIIPGGSPIVGLIVFFIFFSTIGIKTKVVITDVYTGNTNIVDNVPALVSMPASAISTAAYKIFDLSNTAFQGTNGSYMALGPTGFVAPLQILSTLRNGVEGLDPLLAASTKQFIIDCIPGGSLNPEVMSKQTDVMAYVLSTARPNGLTTVFNTAAPSGLATSCSDETTDLTNRVNAYLNTGDPSYGGQSKLVAMVNQSTKQKNPSNTPVSKSDIDAAVNNVILSGMPSVTQNANQFMMNSLMYNTLNNTFNCLDQAGSQATMNSCDIMMTQANEQWKTDSAAASSLFAKTMMPAMVFMQIMFYSLAPIVIIFGLLRGAGAMPMYIKYLGFGVWTSSWMPVAAVIQMYIQNNVAGKLSQITAGGLTMGNFRAINYDVISTNLAIASDMLASTPLVTATILGVSGMAISQLANNMGGKDRVDEKIVTPDLMKSSPLVQGSGMAEFNSNTGIMSQTGAASPKLSFQTSNTSAITSADSVRNAEQATISSDLTKAYQANEQRMLSTIANNAHTTSVNGSVGWRTANGQTIQVGDGASAADANQQAATATASAQAGMQLGASVNAALVPEVMKSLAKEGKTVSEAGAAKMIEASAAKAAAADGNFFQKLARGDQGAIETLVGGIVEVAADGASAAAEVGTLGGGTGAVVAGQAVFRAGGKQAAVAGIMKGVRALGGISEKVQNVGSKIFDQTDAGAKATLASTLQSQEAFKHTKSDQIDQMAKSISDWTRQDTKSGDTTTSDSRGTQNSDASQRSSSASMGQAFKDAQQRTEAADRSFQASVQQAAAGGTKVEMTAPEFIKYMRANPEQAKALQARIEQMEPQIAGAAAKARALIDNSVIAGASEREKNLAAGAMALAGTDSGTNLLSNGSPAGNMTASSNADLKRPDVSVRVEEAAANVPKPGAIQPPQVAATPPASGRAYNQGSIGGIVSAPAQPSQAGSLAPATPPSPASRPTEQAPNVVGRNGASDQGSNAGGTAAGAQPGQAAQPAGGVPAGSQPAQGTPLVGGRSDAPGTPERTDTQPTPGNQQAGATPSGSQTAQAAPLVGGRSDTPGTPERTGTQPTTGNQQAGATPTGSETAQAAPLVGGRSDVPTATQRAGTQPTQPAHQGAPAAERSPAAPQPAQPADAAQHSAPQQPGQQSTASAGQHPHPAAGHANHADKKPETVSRQPAQARPAGAQPAHVPAPVGHGGPITAPLVAPGGVTPDPRPSMAAMMARHSAEGTPIADMQAGINSGPVAQRPMTAPDASKLSVVDQMKAVESTTFGKVTTGAVVAGAALNMTGSFLAGERPDKGQKDGKPTMGGSKEEPPGTAPGAANSAGSGGGARPNGPVLTGGNGKPAPARPARRRR